MSKRRGLKSFNVNFRREKSFYANHEMQLRCNSNLALVSSTLMDIHASSQATERTEGTSATKVRPQDRCNGDLSTSTANSEPVPIVLQTAILRFHAGSMLDFVRSRPEEVATWLETARQSPKWYSDMVVRAS